MVPHPSIGTRIYKDRNGQEIYKRLSETENNWRKHKRLPP